MTSSIGGRGGISQIMTVDDRGGGGVGQIMTVDDRGEGGGLAYLVRPDDVISGQPLINSSILKKFSMPQLVKNCDNILRIRTLCTTMQEEKGESPPFACLCALLCIHCLSEWSQIGNKFGERTTPIMFYEGNNGGYA